MSLVIMSYDCKKIITSELEIKYPSLLTQFVNILTFLRIDVEKKPSVKKFQFLQKVVP